MIDVRIQRLETPRCNGACSVNDFRCESCATTIINNVSGFDLLLCKVLPFTITCYVQKVFDWHDNQGHQ